jgi:hypothetical protein
MALKSHLSSILTEIGNLSPQAMKETTASYKAQIDALSTQLANIDIAEISKVKSSIDSFSVSLQNLQATINRQLQGIKIDQESLEVYSNSSTASHSEPKQANQQSVSEPFDGKIEQPESISRTTWDSDIFSVDAFNQFLFRLSSKTNLKTIEAQKQMINRTHKQSPIKSTI